MPKSEESRARATNEIVHQGVSAARGAKWSIAQPPLPSGVIIEKVLSRGAEKMGEKSIQRTIIEVAKANNSPREKARNHHYHPRK
jgi:hypothetical protein